MLWFMVYLTVAVMVLSIVGAWSARGAHRNTARLGTMLAAALCWPIVALGLLQFGAIRLAAHYTTPHSA